MNEINLSNHEVAAHHSIVIIDDFYETPDNVRQDCISMLKENFFNHNQTGGRCYPMLLGSSTKEYLLGLIKEKFDMDVEIHGGEVRVVTDSDEGFSFVHKDVNAFNIIIYLSKDHDGHVGTSFWEYDGKHNLDDLWNKHLVTESTEESWEAFHTITEEVANPNVWNKKFSIPMKYNRLILFDADCWHSAGDFDDMGRFGDSNETGRLIQYYNVEKQNENNTTTIV